MRSLAVLLSFCLSCHPALAAKPAPKVPVVFLGEINDEDVITAATEMADAMARGGNVRLLIHSFGGSVFAGLDFISAVGMLKQATGAKVECRVEGYAMSMAFVILESQVCDTRVITEGSMLLAHNASGKFAGNAVQIERDLAFLKAIDLTMAELVSARLGMPLEEYQARVFGQDWVLSAREALAVHAVDRVVP